MSEDLYLSDTPEARAVEQVVAALTFEPWPGQLAAVRRLARIAALAMERLVGPDAASRHFAAISGDLLRQRGCGKGRKRA